MVANILVMTKNEVDGIVQALVVGFDYIFFQVCCFSLNFTRKDEHVVE